MTQYLRAWGVPQKQMQYGRLREYADKEASKLPNNFADVICKWPLALPRSVVHNDGGQIVEAGARVRAPGLVEVGQEVIRHVEAAQGKLHVRVQLGPRVGAPSEPLQMQAEHL